MSAASFLSDSKPIRVAVTGAAGQIAYSLFPLLCSGSVFGAKQHLILHCIDIPVPAILEKLEGVKMELDDCAYELLDGRCATPTRDFGTVHFCVSAS